MAKAIRNITTQYETVEVIKYEQKPVTYDKGIILELSTEEAQTLNDIFTKIGGSPDRSRRGHVDAMYEALKSAMVKPRMYKLNYKEDMQENYRLYFLDTKDADGIKST